MFSVDIIAGARPNFMKVAPIISAIKNRRLNSIPISYRLIHTGQHYDKKMSDTFFDQLGIPAPDIHLGCTGQTHAEQTASIMVEYEKVLIKEKPDLCLVVGDVTSTMACAIASKKLGVKVAHVEAGIRSYDWDMPEEVNRIVTDSISDYFFTTTINASQTLLKSGADESCIFFVGNTMIDTLISNIDKFSPPDFWSIQKLEKRKYIVLTLHRPSNVDSRDKLADILNTITSSIEDVRVIFPVHPRTSKMLREIEFDKEKVFLTEALGYLEFNYLVKNSLGVVTDSGGITEEATYMKIPCITVRNSTERPETVSIGSNELIGESLDKLKFYLQKLISGNWKSNNIPDLWDGNAAERIVDNIIKIHEL